MRFVTTLGKALFFAVVLLAGVDVVVRAAIFGAPEIAFPSLTYRLDENFSAAFLDRKLQPANFTASEVFLGDSALWGYKLKPEESAVGILRRRPDLEYTPPVNLSYEGGSTPNTYALVKLLTARGIKPGKVIFNLNIKEFNTADSAYNTLYPAVERLVWPLLTDDERKLLHKTQADTIDARADRAIGGFWALYGMRADIRELLFGAPDAATALMNAQHRLSGEAAREEAAHRPTPDRFLGTYDLTPLDESNVGVVFLRKTLRLLKAHGIGAYAILTPTNHALLHEYIDVPEYRANLDYLGKIARAEGATVLDYDHAFAGPEFIDNDHLTAAGNRRLAGMLRDSVYAGLTR